MAVKKTVKFSPPTPKKRSDQRSWRSMVSVAREAIEAIDAGKLKEARRCVEAMRAIATEAAAVHQP
jgi:hypothetical protein